MLGLNPKDLKRMMKKLGITAEEVEAVTVSVQLRDGGVMLVDSPQVLVIRAKGQPPMLYVVGETRIVEGGGEPEFTEEDVRLVAEQAGVSEDEARRALEETGGDIAAAILKLRGH